MLKRITIFEQKWLRRGIIGLFAVCAIASVSGCSANAELQEYSAPEPLDAAAEGLSLFERRVEVIAMSCAACHGTDGRKATAIPALAGKPFPVLNALLLAYRSDQMPDATVMPRIANAYTEEELRAVAEYFANITPGAEE